MVIKPLLETTLPTEPPLMMYRSLLALAALPTLTAPLENTPPLVITKLLLAAVAPPTNTAPPLVMTPPLPTSTRLLLAEAELPIQSTPPPRLTTELLPAAFWPATVTVLLDWPSIAVFQEPRYNPVARLRNPPLVTVTLLPPPNPPPPGLMPKPTITDDADVNVPLFTMSLLPAAV